MYTEERRESAIEGPNSSLKKNRWWREVGKENSALEMRVCSGCCIVRRKSTLAVPVVVVGCTHAVFSGTSAVTRPTLKCRPRLSTRRDKR